MPVRECSRTACSRPAVSTLTYVYEDSTAVLGPLSARSEPHSYDLCHDHGGRLTAPRGWKLLRIPGAGDAGDDLTALAQALDGHPPGLEDGPDALHAVSDPGRRRSGTGRSRRNAADPAPRHLHVVRSPDEPTE